MSAPSFVVRERHIVTRGRLTPQRRAMSLILIVDSVIARTSVSQIVVGTITEWREPGFLSSVPGVKGS
jgi:hypothetical protein